MKRGALSALAVVVLGVPPSASIAGADVFTNGQFTVYRYDVAGHPTSTTAFSEEFADVAVGPDGFIYATSDVLGLGSVDRIDPVTGAFSTLPVANVPTPANYAQPLGLAFAPDGTMYVGSNAFNLAPHIAGVTGVLRYDPVAQAYVPFATISATPNTFSVFDVAVAPGGDVYAAIANVGVVRYDHASGASLGVVVPESSGVGFESARINFGSDGALYLNDADGTIRRFDPVTGAALGTFITAALGAANPVTGFNFGSDGRVYVTYGQAGQIVRYDALTGARLDVFSSDPADIRTFRWEAVYVPEPLSMATFSMLGAGTVVARRRR